MPVTPNGIPFDVPNIGSVQFGKNAETDTIGVIEPGGFWNLQIRGRDLEETDLRPWLPFTHALISNQSNSDIRVQFGDQKKFSVNVGPKRSVPLSDEPFVKVTIWNVGTTQIEKDEINIILSNDMASILRYIEMCEKGLLHPLILPLTIRRAGDKRRVF